MVAITRTIDTVHFALVLAERLTTTSLSTLAVHRIRIA